MLLNCVLEKTLESLLDCKEIQPVHSEGDQPWDFFGRNDAKAETPVLWPPHAKSWLIGRDSDAGRDWGQEEKATTEDEMAGWHHWLDGRESEWTPGDGDGQGGLACCDSWGRKESETTEWLNWTELIQSLIIHFSLFRILPFIPYSLSFGQLISHQLTHQKVGKVREEGTYMVSWASQYKTLGPQFSYSINLAEIIFNCFRKVLYWGLP